MFKNFKKYLPLKFKRGLINYRFNSYYKKSFSQFGEDLIILNYFKEFKNLGKKYLDIGGFHPIMISNTHLLYLNGWEGTVVDTSDHKLNLFKQKRGDKVNLINKAVVSNEEKNEILDFYFFEKEFSEIDTLSLEFAQTKKKELGINFTCKSIKTIKVNDLLSKDNFDFLNIDVEGLDEDILSSLNFEIIHKPKLICFEIHDHLNTNNKAINHLKSNGYEFLFKSGKTLGFNLG